MSITTPESPRGTGGLVLVPRLSEGQQVAMELLQRVWALEEREVERALRRLRVESPAVHGEVERMAARLSRRILGAPLRSLSRPGDGEAPALARRLFGL